MTWGRKSTAQQTLSQNAAEWWQIEFSGSLARDCFGMKSKMQALHRQELALKTGKDETEVGIWGSAGSREDEL